MVNTKYSYKKWSDLMGIKIKIKMIIVLVVAISITLGILFYSSNNSEKTIPKKAKFVKVQENNIEMRRY